METIYLDLSRPSQEQQIFCKQGDVGKTFRVVFTDAGVPYRPNEQTCFSVWYSGTSGEGNYTEINGSSAFTLDGDGVTVELIAQMLANKGGGTLCLVMNDVTGKQIGTWNIHYFVEGIPGHDSEPATAYFNAFAESISSARENAQIAENAANEAADILSSRAEGRSSNYRLSSSGWKRIFIGIRGHSGTVNLSLGCNNALGHTVQNIALGYSMYADWPASKITGMAGQGTYPGGGPRVWQISNNCFGEDPAQVDLSQIYRIDKVRVAYPINWDTTTDADTTGQYQNPVNCYLDIHVAGDVRLYNGSALVQLMTNILGKSDNHGTSAIIEETDVQVDAEGYVLGSLGEKCQTVEFMLHEDSAYSVDEPSRFKELLTESTYQLTDKSISTEHFIEDALYDVRKLSVPMEETGLSGLGIRASRKNNMVPGRTGKFGAVGGVKVEQVGSGLYRLTGTAAGNAIAKIYEYAAGDVPIVMKKGVTYYISGMQLYINTPAMNSRVDRVGYKSGILVANTVTYTPTQDMYVQRIALYISSGNVYDGHLYYPQISTDASAIVGDLQTGAVRTEYDAYAAEQTALGKLPLHYVSWLDRKLGADRYSPDVLWIDAGGAQTSRAVIDFAESHVQLWDDGSGTVTVVDDPRIALYRREVIRAGALSLVIKDTDGSSTLSTEACSIEGTVKESSANVAERIAQNVAHSYGLGDISTKVLADKSGLDTLVKSGFYTVLLDTGDFLAPDYWAMFMSVAVVAYNDTGCMQTVRAVGKDETLQRIRNSGVWGDWEWINPKMTVGTEYRTTRRFNGKAIYTMSVNVGRLPNTAQLSISAPFSYTQLVAISGSAVSDSGLCNAIGSFKEVAIWGDLNANVIHILTTDNRSTTNAVIVFEYIKE